MVCFLGHQGLRVSELKLLVEEILNSHCRGLPLLSPGESVPPKCLIANVILGRLTKYHLFHLRMYFYHRTDDMGNPLVSCHPPADRSLPLFVLLCLYSFCRSYQLIPHCIEQSIKKLSWYKMRPFWMHGMCENGVKRGVMTGSPTKEKREMEPLGGIHHQRRVCVACEGFDTDWWTVAQKSRLVVLHKWFSWGNTDVTIARFCICSNADQNVLDPFLRCRNQWHGSVSNPHIVSDLLMKIKRKWLMTWQMMWLASTQWCFLSSQMSTFFCFRKTCFIRPV